MRRLFLKERFEQRVLLYSTFVTPTDIDVEQARYLISLSTIVDWRSGRVLEVNCASRRRAFTGCPSVTLINVLYRLKAQRQSRYIRVLGMPSYSGEIEPTKTSSPCFGLAAYIQSLPCSAYKLLAFTAQLSPLFLWIRVVPWYLNSIPAIK